MMSKTEQCCMLHSSSGLVWYAILPTCSDVHFVHHKHKTAIVAFTSSFSNILSYLMTMSTHRKPTITFLRLAPCWFP